MKQRLAIRSISTLIALSCAISLAHATDSVATLGPYVEFSAGIAHSNGDYGRQVEQSIQGSSQFRFATADYDRWGGAGGRVALGWTLHPNLAFEAGYSELGRYESLAGASIVANPADTTYRRGRFKARAGTFDAVGQYAITAQVTLTARLGVAAIEQTYTQRSFTTLTLAQLTTSFPSNRQYRLHWGVGGRYALNEKTALTLNYSRAENVGNDFSSQPIRDGVRAGTFGYGLLAFGVRYSF